MSYTVPILKGGISPDGKSVTVDDFRGIAISPVLSKVFEHCVLDRYMRTCLQPVITMQCGFKNDLAVLMQSMLLDA